MVRFDDQLVVQGIPDSVNSEERALFRSRLFTAVNRLRESTGLQTISITVSTPEMLVEESTKIQREQARHPGNGEASTEERTQQYQARKPLYSFAQLVVSDETMEDLLSAVETVSLTPVVFEQWGLRKIEPYPRSALNFYGPSGTGKTLAAHAIADKLGRDILIASYAEVESKYVGDGPKNVKALFLAAERKNAVLFIDEADSLLSKRLTNVTQGAEQAINSMRSQLLICLEQFSGIVIFATNLVKNYDKAFETRVRHVRFSLPDKQARVKIWQSLLVADLPVRNISVEELADATDDISGRDIKNAIIDAAVRTARLGRSFLEMADLLNAIQRVKAARIADEPVPVHAMTAEQRASIKERVLKTFSDDDVKSNGAPNNLEKAE